MQKNILVTGATSGFGKAIATVFAANGWNCIITGRRKERLDELAATLTNDYKIDVLPLCFDVRDKSAVFSQLMNLPGNWQSIAVLVNNAGLALGRDSFEKANLDDWDTMIDTNVKGIMYVTKALMPLLINNKTHVLNIGSIAGKEVYKDGNAYCASKHAVDAISKSMRIDLLSYGIKVTAIHPGAAETEFSVVRYKGDLQKADNTYVGFEPLVAKDIADITWYCANLPAHVCINDLTVTCTAQANATIFHKE
jgi:3-hydroxy acid dehydrogenase / malonic semialdehyde reductase